MRPSQRQLDQLRDISIERNFTCHAEGSVLISIGRTRVLCTATIEESVPRFLRGKRAGSLPNTVCCPARRTRA